jgi:hypothetical protein
MLFQIMRSMGFPFNLNDRTRQVVTASVAWVGIAAASTLVFLFNPAQQSNGAFFPACPFRALTGLQCPGCGSTRGLHQLLHGHLGAAFQLNPLFVVMLPFIIYGLIRFTSSAITGKPRRRILIPPMYLWAWLFLLLSFWIFRNTSLYPFVS